MSISLEMQAELDLLWVAITNRDKTSTACPFIGVNLSFNRCSSTFLMFTPKMGCLEFFVAKEESLRMRDALKSIKYTCVIFDTASTC